MLTGCPSLAATAPPPVPSCVSEPGYCPVRLGMTTGRLQSGVNTLQGFKEDKRNKVAPGKAARAVAVTASSARSAGSSAALARC